MKIKVFCLLLTLLTVSLSVSAKKYPVIKFDKTTVYFGTFSQDSPVQSCVFRFTNVGKSKLVINYVHTACGCTAATYTKDFISPGGSGEIRITYDGTGRMPGKFKKYIQVFTNCKNDLTRLFIQGDMSAMPEETLKSNK